MSTANLTANTTGHRRLWDEQGYLVLRGVLDKSRLATLQNICDRALTQWQSSPAEEQPGGFAWGPDAWVMIHLNHPRYHVQRNHELTALLDLVADPLAVKTLRELFGAEPLFAQMNYYINPPKNTRIGNWHRDCQFFKPNDESGERELFEQEKDPPLVLHMHVPFLTTCATHVVPGSHKTWDNAEQLRIRRHDSRSDQMPDALVLELEPGDLAFFHVNALHRGMYYTDIPRRTIALTYSHPSRPVKADEQLMRTWKGYVASFQPWCLKQGYLDNAQPGTRELFQRFIDTYRDSWHDRNLVPELGEKRIAYFTQF